MSFVRVSSMKAALLAACAIFAVSALANAGDVSGKVTYKGDKKPGRKVIKMDADPKCVALHGDKKVGTEDFVINKDMEIQNVFVYLKDYKGAPAAPPAETAMIDQHGCQYVPHVQGIIAGQKFVIRNSDNTMHNIHFLGKANPEFNFGQPTPGDRDKEFRKPEMMAKFKCDVHPWMNAFIFVMDNPYFAVTDEKGAFTIKGVPAGDYTLVAWHEKFGETEQKIKVAADPLGNLSFTFTGTGE